MTYSPYGHHQTMKARPVELPYGLSSHHRHASCTGRSLPLNYGISPRWSIPTLDSWLQAAAPTADPIYSHIQTTARSKSYSQRRTQEQRITADVGTELSASRIPPGVPNLQAKVYLRLDLKRPTESSQNSGSSEPKVKKLRNSAARLGICADTLSRVPITVNSSDETEIVQSDEDKSRRSANKWACTPKKHKAVGSSKSCNAPDHSFLLHTPPAIGKSKLDAPVRCSRPVETGHMTPESTQTGSRVAGKKTRRRQSTSPVPEDHDPDDVELQLKDIPDFPLRSKVAQLMAVAPAFSVSQLYHPLVDKEGHFETAKEYIMPKSPANLNASYLATSVKRQVVLSQSSNSNPTQDPYDDQVMVKIDWDNSDLLFDNDAPSFLFPEPKKSKKKPTKKTPQPRAISKPKKQQTKKQPQPKKRAPPQKPSSTKAPPKKPHASHSTTAHTNKAASPFAPPPRPASIPTEPSSKIQTRATHARANTSVKRRAHTPPRSSAHTTINDSDFLVPDEHVLSDSDQSYINSDAVDESEGSGDESD